MARTHVLFLGATGYVGGPVAQRLLALGYAVTTLVRKADARAKALRDAGAEVILGDLDSLDLIKKLAQSSSAVFACAANSHLPSIEAVLEGFKARRKAGKSVGILVHTSGTGVFAKGDARGLPPGPDDKVYSDLDVAAIEALGTAHPQRKVHVKIISAAEAGDVRSYIVLPSTIFGISSLPGVGTIFNKHSNQMPALIRGSIKKKQAGLVGEYRNTWPLVHTDDLTDLYQLVLEAALSGEDAGQGRGGYYIAANGQYVGREAAEKVGIALHKRGLAATVEPAPFTDEEMKAFYGAYANFAGTNSQATAERSRRLGWAPRHDHQALLDSLDGEVQSIWEEEFQ
ncbi:hypothetical protein JCM10450v2_000080 [Rhodotorula kratochvilovae]